MPSLGGKLYRVGEIRVDRAQRCVCRDGETVYPRAHAFDMLLYLIERRERVVSRQEMLQALWPDVAVTDNSIMQCVNEVRRALGDDSRNPRYIRTVVKAGYQFIAPVEESGATLVEHVTSVELSYETENESGPLDRPRRSRARWLGVVAAGVIAALVLGAGSAAWLRQPVGPSKGEVAWWKFDESGPKAVDSVRGLIGPLPSGLSRTSGISGAALLFPGSELVLRGEDSGVLPRGADARTFIAWVRTVTTNGDSTVIFTQGNPDSDSGADHFYLMMHDSGGGRFRVQQFPALSALSGADIGQDFSMEVELRVPAALGLVTEAGPYFRSRRARPGDGLFGGTSAGFWVQLLNTGQVRVMRLRPMVAIASSEDPAGFDSSVFHKIAVSMARSWRWRSTDAP